ncbi:MAG: 50S ribosomal protein L17 [Candidatus Eremiobacteraeota bacterium]|nr:50S ribosomal protein L17 [Candidatus Eremiobacteraeota bacterium]
MRHARHGKKLGRNSAQRRALYAGLAAQLIEHGRIKTTVTKAKAVKPIAEQMITLGRRGDIHARRQATAFLRSKEVVHHLFTTVAPAFADRPGGYARIVKLGPRQGDSAEMAYLELVGEPLVFKTKLADLPEDVAAPAPAEEPVDEGDTAVEDEVAAEAEPEPEPDQPQPDEEPTGEANPDATAGPAAEAEAGDQEPRNS